MPTRDVKGSKRSVVVYLLMHSTSSYIASMDIVVEVSRVVITSAVDLLV